MELLQEIAKYWPLIVGITVCYGWLWSLHWKITMNAKAIEELQTREAGLEKRFVDKFDTFYTKMSACMKDGNKDLDTKITETRRELRSDHNNLDAKVDALSEALHKIEGMLEVRNGKDRS